MWLQTGTSTDPIFILNIVIQYYKKKKKPLYMCFVDFKKAFDLVSHNKLWLKLASIGISSKILTLLKSMYSDAIWIVKINSEISSSFPEHGLQSFSLFPPYLTSCKDLIIILASYYRRSNTHYAQKVLDRDAT